MLERLGIAFVQPNDEVRPPGVVPGEAALANDEAHNVADVEIVHAPKLRTRRHAKRHVKRHVGTPGQGFTTNIAGGSQNALTAELPSDMGREPVGSGILRGSLPDVPTLAGLLIVPDQAGSPKD